MARYEHLPIFQAVYLLTSNLYQITDKFPRQYKYTMGQDIRHTCNKLIKLIVKVNSIKNKKESLNELELGLEYLRIYLRLAFDLDVLGVEKLGELNEQIEEAIKQTSGWRKWAERK